MAAGGIGRWMGAALRALWRLALGVLLLGAAMAALALYLAQRSLPDYSASRTLEGLTAPVEILRDVGALPHIFAANDADAYFALGYVHAQDRLWQMELRRRVVEGRLTETFGAFARLADRLSGLAGPQSAGEGGAGPQESALLRLDVAIRALDLAGAAERAAPNLAPETRAALEAYSAGVNAWLAEVDAGALGGGAPELLALGLTVAPWRPQDSVASLKLLAATLSASFVGELERGALAIAVGPRRAADLFADEAAPAAPPEAAASTPTGAAFEAWAAALGAPLGRHLDARGGASNAWAVSGVRSASRAPLLATDPHLPLTAPGVWYLARLDLSSGGVIGATLPGVPAVLIGRNERIGWGLTTLYADVADVYLEELDPADPNRYRTDDGWAEFETREVVIPIGGGRAVATALRRTVRGPVLPLDWDLVARVTPPGHVASLAWTALAEDDATLDAALEMMRAGSVEEALALAPKVVAPPQVVIAADAERIALGVVGRLPLRQPESETRGALPSRGWRPENAWIGQLSRWETPRLVDPASGVLAHANTRVGDSPFPRDLAQHWPESYRQQRILDLLAAREFHTPAGFQTMQSDTVSEMARSVLPRIARPLWAGLERETGLRRAALERLAAWSGEMDAVAPEPLIFTAWTRALMAGLAADDLGPSRALALAPRPRFLERVFDDVDGAAGRWCDDVTTTPAESCAEIASAALDVALAELEAAYGARIDRWRWGRAHAARFAHEPFGRAPLLGLLFDIHSETGGGDHTIRRAQSRGAGPDPYETVHGPGFRAVYDFADLDRSVAAIATGQSGHFLSRHYDDAVETWRAGDYRPLSLAREDVEIGAVGVTRLAPPSGVDTVSGAVSAAPAVE